MKQFIAIKSWYLIMRFSNNLTLSKARAFCINNLLLEYSLLAIHQGRSIFHHSSKYQLVSQEVCYPCIKNAVV